MSENFNIQCGEVLLHLLHGTLTFHCTLCEEKFQGFKDFSYHVASEHIPVAPVDTIPVELVDCGAEVPAGIDIKEEESQLLENDNSLSSFANDFDKDDYKSLDEYEVEADNLEEQKIFVDYPEHKEPKKIKRERVSKEKMIEDSLELLSAGSRPVRIRYVNKTDERQHSCPVCDFSCKLLRNLKGHMRRHSKEKPFPCEYCERGFYTTTELKVHMRVHTGDRPFLCNVCGARYITSSKLAEHRKRHENEPNDYQCENCGKNFADGKSLKRHSVIHRNERNVKCDQCDACFNTKAALKDHQKEHVSENLEYLDSNDLMECDDNSDNTTAEMEIKQEEEDWLENSLCSLTEEYDKDDYKSLNEYEVEAENLKEGNNFVEYSESNSPTTIKKENVSIENELSLNQSGLRPVRIRYINKADDRKHHCPLCNFSCKLLRNLNGHMRRHSTEKPFPCEYCERGFYTSSELRVHTLMHTGERPYLCNVCGARFITTAKLSEHKKRHENELIDYECQKCGKNFADEKSLQRHSVIHKSEHEEKHRKFNNKLDLHLKTFD